MAGWNCDKYMAALLERTLKILSQRCARLYNTSGHKWAHCKTPHDTGAYIIWYLMTYAHTVRYLVMQLSRVRYLTTQLHTHKYFTMLVHSLHNSAQHRYALCTIPHNTVGQFVQDLTMQWGSLYNTSQRRSAHCTKLGVHTIYTYAHRSIHPVSVPLIRH